MPVNGSSAIDSVHVFARNCWSKMEQSEVVAILRLAIGELPLAVESLGVRERAAVSSWHLAALRHVAMPFRRVAMGR